jgi:hypothetical protein
LLSTEVYTARRIEKNMKSLKTLEFVGATLTIVGSFLPWEIGGGFLGPVINGIRVDIANFKYWVTGIHVFPIYDYGGVLIVFLTLLIILPVIRPLRFIKDPILWNLIVSASLMVSSLLFVGRWGIHRYQEAGSAEPSTLIVEGYNKLPRAHLSPT